MNIHQLKKQLDSGIVDYGQLKAALQHYAQPRRKISYWLKSGDLIRVKKGLYIFGKHVADKPFSTEVLANLIYGPSAISLNYALWFYGLIPERVEEITSITNKRNKSFVTPVGNFSYRFLSNRKYAVGIQLLKTTDGLNFLIATPEKALCDLIVLNIKKLEMLSQSQFKQFLFDDLRIDEEALLEIDFNLLQKISNAYQNKTLKRFLAYFNQWKSNHE